MKLLTKKLKVLVIDDDPLALKVIADYVKATDGLELVSQTTNPRKGMDVLKKNEIHLIFLDMEMPGMSGMAFLAQLKILAEDNPSIANISVVVCSAFDRFAADSFDYEAVDYLVKPVFFERYTRAVKKVKQRWHRMSLNMLSSDNDCLMVYTTRGKLFHKLRYEDIIYLEAKGEKTWIWVSESEYFEIDDILKNVMLLLPRARFARVHRAFAISLVHFEWIKGMEIQLKGAPKNKIKLGRKGDYELFKDWLAENAIKGRHFKLSS
ncbi:LytR/AlgR family response regulator transcription factor [Sphingobacterium chuzhouense]|uniref:Response regulator transcription factor n=1 Tax=Sphingobacterium chuzhouense TaxID=1742264 RepID=A0ABR7XXF1_9SPHI|nr:LytTR family DNA-binding domain-containing protein [Sphingobacterium chuzhouense]MBD1423746.1 response regulator transcription factor [Sphingobacterium chuzhouense]